MSRSPFACVAFVSGLALSTAACIVNPPAETTATVPQEGIVAAKRDSEMICQDYVATASRVRRQKVCMTAEEWDAVNDDAKGYSRSMQNSGSAQAGGESLQGQ